MVWSLPCHGRESGGFDTLTGRQFRESVPNGMGLVFQTSA